MGLGLGRCGALKPRAERTKPLRGWDGAGVMHGIQLHVRRLEDQIVLAKADRR